MLQFNSYGINDMPLSRELYEKAYDQGMSFSQFLEFLNPTEPGDTTGLDAFDRQLRRFGIRSKRDSRFGLPASKGQLFFQPGVPESRILFPEFLNRTARRALIDEENSLNMLIAHWDQLQGTSVYRSIYIDEDVLDRRQSEVVQYGKFPVVAIKWSEKATTLKKYGVKLQASYEFIRQASLPVIEMLVQRIMLQERIDELGLALKVLHDGDGETKEGGGITTTNLSTLGVTNPDGIDDLTYVNYLKWLHMFAPGQCSIIVGNVDTMVHVMTMDKPNVDPVFLMQSLGFNELGGRPRVVNPRIAQNISYIIHDDAPDDEIVGVDPRFALIGYREAGADLTETQRIIDGQWEEIVLSNTVGFSNVFRSAVRKLDTDN